MARPVLTASFLRRLLAPAIALVLTALLAWSGALGRLDRGWHDLLQRELAPKSLADPDTAIVLIDEQSLQAMGSEQYGMRWPWPRHAFAALFAGLHRSGAKAIVGDFLFLEHSEDGMHDAILGGVAGALTRVTLGAKHDKNAGEVQLPVVWPEEFRRSHPKFFSDRMRWGFVDAHPDSDGVLRHYLSGSSLVEAALGKADRDTQVPTLVRWRGTLRQVEAREVPILPAAPFVAAGLEMITQALNEVPDLQPDLLLRVIETQPEPTGEIFSRIRGRTVFVGVNAAAAFDAKATPANKAEPGVLLHWNAWQNFVGDEFLAEAGGAASAACVLLIVVAIVAAGWAGSGIRRPAIVAIASGVALIGASALAFHGGTWFAPASPVAAAAISFTAVAVESFRRERARKREIQGWFGAYVSPAVVKRLVENPEALNLGGEKRDVSIFFCDLAGFTTMSEKLPDHQLVSVVNLCLEEFSAPIFDHGGYLDKYIGDAIMGVFGSPEELENHALAATRAALECQRRLPRLNERLQREFDVTVGVRFGINTGDATMGNVGSTRKKNYTALGDPVNLASRLEGANKEFHTQILLGPLTAARVAGEILTRPVARLRVKGKTKAVEVFEPLGTIAVADETTRRFVAACKEGFDAWSARRFEQAARAWADALILRPDDFLTTRYLADARRLVATPPPADWEPILNLESK
jgi:adenylate cyclase